MTLRKDVVGRLASLRIETVHFRYGNGVSHYKIMDGDVCLESLGTDNLEEAQITLADYHADSIIQLVLDEAAKRVEQFERPRMDADDFTFIREAAAAIRALGKEGEK